MSDDWFLDVPDKYKTRYLLCYEHIETCSPDGYKACSEYLKGTVEYEIKCDLLVWKYGVLHGAEYS